MVLHEKRTTLHGGGFDPPEGGLGEYDGDPRRHRRLVFGHLSRRELGAERDGDIP